MAKIFLTGATGYIGGELLHSLVASHPEYSIRTLVRNDAHREAITSAFKNVEVVSGSLDDVDILATEAAAADVVLNVASSGHLKSVQAIHKALAERPGKPAHWIQVSGASVLAAAELVDKSFVPGELSDAVFDDLDGLSEIHDIVRRHPSRAVDNFIIFEAAETPGVNTALVVPPIIYGEGRGPVNQRSVQVPELAKVTIQRGRGLQLGRGLNRWGTVHVQDLGELFVRIVEEAVAGASDVRLWNANGVYLTGIGETTFGDISKSVASVAAQQGLIPTNEVESLSPGEAGSLLPHATAIFGTNARSKARRGSELLGWKPSRVSLEDDILRTVELEAKTLARGSTTETKL